MDGVKEEKELKEQSRIFGWSIWENRFVIY